MGKEDHLPSGFVFDDSCIFKQTENEIQNAAGQKIWENRCLSKAQADLLQQN